MVIQKSVTTGVRRTDEPERIQTMIINVGEDYYNSNSYFIPEAITKDTRESLVLDQTGQPFRIEQKHKIGFINFEEIKNVND
jgi:hypothetical protein